MKFFLFIGNKIRYTFTTKTTRKKKGSKYVEIND